MYEATRSLAARSSSVKDSRVTPPPSSFPTSPRSEILHHSRSSSITFLSPPGIYLRSLILARAEVAGLAERAEQEVRLEPIRRDAVPSRYGTGRKQRVQDRLLRRLRRGVEERCHALVRERLKRYGLRELGEPGPGDAAVAGGE